MRLLKVLPRHWSRTTPLPKSMTQLGERWPVGATNITSKCAVWF